jgi:hypothetical protein
LQKKQRLAEAPLPGKNPPQNPGNTPERQKLQAEAMRQMRAARESIDPALLARARETILKSAPDLAGRGTAPASEAADEAVDKVRTLTVLKEFLLLKRDNKALCGEIRTMLTTTDKR